MSSRKKLKYLPGSKSVDRETKQFSNSIQNEEDCVKRNKLKVDKDSVRDASNQRFSKGKIRTPPRPPSINTQNKVKEDVDILLNKTVRNFNRTNAPAFNENNAPIIRDGKVPTVKEGRVPSVSVRHPTTAKSNNVPLRDLISAALKNRKPRKSKRYSVGSSSVSSFGNIPETPAHLKSGVYYNYLEESDGKFGIYSNADVFYNSSYDNSLASSRVDGNNKYDDNIASNSRFDINIDGNNRYDSRLEHSRTSSADSLNDSAVSYPELQQCFTTDE